MYSVKDVTEIFLQMEEENHFFDTIKVGNIHVWHYIRYNVYLLLLEMLADVSNPNMEKMFLKEKKTFKDQAEEYVIKNQFQIRKKEVFILNHSRRVKRGKYYKCLYTDEWLKGFSHSYYVFEMKYGNKIHFKPVRTKNLRYIDKQQYNKIFNKKYEASQYNIAAEKCKNEIVEVVQKTFRIELSARCKKRIFQLALDYTVGREVNRDYYSYLLRHIKPEIIMFVIGYSLDGMVLAELGKEMGIPTIELEHGPVNNGLAYNFKGNLQLNSFPDHIFVAGQIEKDTVNAPIDKKNIHVVGSPELDSRVIYYEKALAHKKKKKKIITFIPSGEIEMAEAAVELCEKIDKQEYKIYFKLHPSEYSNWKRKYHGLEKSGIQIVDDSKHDIYYYMAVSDFVIGVASTALFEATRFSCHIMILTIGRYYNCQSIVDTGNGSYISSMDEAAEYIENTQEQRTPSDYFYRSGSKTVMYRTIDEIIKSKSK